MQIPLPVSKRVPKVQKYLSFDRSGLLWVNLFAQKGPLLLVDPLSFHISLQYTLDSVAANCRFMRHNSFGFAAVFSDDCDLVLFTYDFARSRHLRNPGLVGIPTIKYVSNRLFLWSRAMAIFVYDVGDSLDRVQFLGTFAVPSPPTDIVASLNPELIFVSCEDFTLTIRLGKAVEYALRMPDAKLTISETQFAHSLLGPPLLTKSRALFTEMGAYRFIATPVRIAAFDFSDVLTLVVAVYQNGHIGSIWVVHETQQAVLRHFDSFEHWQPQHAHQAASVNFVERIAQVQGRRQAQLDMHRKVKEFDEAVF
jgi:hypothetical protein